MKRMKGQRKCHLIIPGAQKSGTTWMHNTLESQKEFWCPAQNQEVHFFDRYYDSGYKKYEKKYKKSKNNQITLDVTPAYLCNKMVPNRIKAYEKVSKRKIKIVAILRNPVERAISAYKMKVMRGGYSEKLSEAIDVDTTLIQKSKYEKPIKKYKSKFGSKGFKTLITKELFEHTEDKLRELGEFVGAEREVSNPYGSRRVNAASEGRSYGVVQGISRILRRVGAEKIVHWVKRSRWSTLFRTKRSHTYVPNVDKKGIKRLRDELTDDARMVSKRIGRPDLMSIWNLD